MTLFSEGQAIAATPGADGMLGVLGGINHWNHRWYAPGGGPSLTQIGDVFADLTLSGLRP